MQKNELKLSSKGYFSIEVLDKDGNRVESKCSKEPSENVVTYYGAYWSFITRETHLSADSESYMLRSLYADVGTGTAEITRSAVGLNSPTGSRSTGRSASRAGNEVDNLDGTSTLILTRTFGFPLGSKVGTFSEVGVYNDASAGGLVAGQLIKDELDQPTTVTVLADEQLVITYTLEWTYPNTAALAGTGTVTDAASNTYDYEVWVQPFFSNYSINNSDINTRFFANYDNTVHCTPYDASGSQITYSDTGPFTFSVSHDGSGNVNITTGTVTMNPADFSGTVGFVGLGSRINASTYSSYRSLVSTTPPLVQKVSGVNYTKYSPVFVIKFLDPLDKSNSEVLGFELDVQIQI